MKVTDLRKMKLSELNDELKSLLRAQFSLRMQIATQQISNTNQIKNTRRDIARIKTIISQKINNHE